MKDTLAHQIIFKSSNPDEEENGDDPDDGGKAGGPDTGTEQT
jgi:hypothetical protein